MNNPRNQLHLEQSPYLLQHAENPVDWLPWKSSSFSLAKELNRPIFLSIGYSTCHWCHVMERESFEHEEVATLLNETFVCIKVDREERPDVDAIYMEVAQMLTGQGGWPLTVFLTPDKYPFFAGTYFPPMSRHGRIGLYELTMQVKKLWASDTQKCVASADHIYQQLQNAQATQTSEHAQTLNIEQCVADITALIDTEFGGFGAAPKFPNADRLLFLLRSGNQSAQEAVYYTLDQMCAGGIYDHVGGGFHRYSTDARWRVPHFEKMLYDQALLVPVYLEAYLYSQNTRYREVVEETLDYVIEYLRHEDGGFYAAEDADSEGVEGAFYIWSSSDFDNLLEVDVEAFKKEWHIEPMGNYLDELTDQYTGKNILYRELETSEAQRERMTSARQQLKEIRAQRERPFLDRKILTDWNGLMIAAFARTGRVLDHEGYKQIALEAYEVLLAHVDDEQGAVYHYRMDKQVKGQGTLNDYAYLMHATFELYEMRYEEKYLQDALGYQQIIDEQFADETRGGYFMTSAHDADTILRPREIYDGALPSGNSMAFENRMRLKAYFPDQELSIAAAKLKDVYIALAQQASQHISRALLALQVEELEREHRYIFSRKRDNEKLMSILSRSFSPAAVTRWITQENQQQVASTLPEVASFVLEDEVSVTICSADGCMTPLDSAEELKRMLLKTIN